MESHAAAKRHFGRLLLLGLCGGCSLLRPELGQCADDEQCAQEFGPDHTCNADSWCESLATSAVASDSCVDPSLAYLPLDRYVRVATGALSNGHREFGDCVDASMDGNDAFFAVDLKEGEHWHFHLRTLSETVDAALFILPTCDARTCLASASSDSCGPGADEHLTIIAPHTGKFLVSVDAHDAGGGEFEVLANRTQCGDGVLDPGETCDDNNVEAEDGCDPDCRVELPADAPTEVEPNDNTVDANVLVLDGAEGTVTVNASLGARCDADTFTIDVPEGGILDAAVTPLEADEDCASVSGLDVVLRDPSGEKVRTVMEDPARECPLLLGSDATLADLSGGRYYITVNADEDAERFDYALSVTITTVAPPGAHEHPARPR